MSNAVYEVVQQFSTGNSDKEIVDFVIATCEDGDGCKGVSKAMGIALALQQTESVAPYPGASTKVYYVRRVLV